MLQPGVQCALIRSHNDNSIVLCGWLGTGSSLFGFVGIAINNLPHMILNQKPLNKKIRNNQKLFEGRHVRLFPHSNDHRSGFLVTDGCEQFCGPCCLLSARQVAPKHRVLTFFCRETVPCFGAPLITLYGSWEVLNVIRIDSW